MTENTESCRSANGCEPPQVRCTARQGSSMTCKVPVSSYTSSLFPIQALNHLFFCFCRYMASARSCAPEALGPLTEDSTAETWSAASRVVQPFIFTREDEDGRVVSQHLIQWEPPPKRAHASGLTGSARVLQSRPATAVFGHGNAVRLHICRQKPCRANYHPSKYGNLPCPQAHGRITDWGREAWAKHASCEDVVVVEASEAATSHEGADLELNAEETWLAPVDVPAGNALVQADIMRRACEMRTAGRYIGLWEILCWCACRQIRCRILLAEGLVDIVNAFAPLICTHRWAREPCAHVIVGCQADEEEEGPHAAWIPCGMAGVSHFIAGLAMGSSMDAVGRNVRDHCLRNGFAPVMTVANGDCGLDAMLIIAGVSRSPLERVRLRCKLSDFMITKAEEVPWQEAFLVLQEHEPGLVQPTALAVVAVDDTAAAVVAADPAAASELEPPPLPPPADRPEDDFRRRLRAAVAWASGSEKLPAECTYRIAALLTAEQAATVVERHAEDGGKPAQTSAIAKVGARLLGRMGGAATLTVRLRDAACVNAWLRKNGLDAASRLPPRTWKLFWADHGSEPLTRLEQCRSRSYIGRCLRLARAHAGPRRASTYTPAGRHTVRFRRRRRQRGTQGRPTKASLVREHLFQWFCSIKRSVKTRLPARVVLAHAKSLLEKYVLTCVIEKQKADAPVLSHSWLRDWCLQYGVCLRKPNRRCEVPKHVMQERLRVLWCNIIRVRRLAILLLGYDLGIDNMDQSPFHMNEAGSKKVGSLCLRGCGVVPLTEVHSDTRERWTVNTMVRSDFEAGNSLPPLEVMFKAEGGRMRAQLQQHIPTWAPWLTVVTSPSASYQECDLLDYLERVFPLPVQPRQRWRILLLDAYKPHMTERVRRCAWLRHVVVCIHGGGTTSVGQVNDTDLHRPLKKEYIDLEMEDALRQAALGKACPLTRKEDAMAWMSLVWFQPRLHADAAQGFKKVGFANALDGTEDDRVCREARSYWDRLQMKHLRASAVADVDEEVRAGRMRWTYRCVYSVIGDHPKRGHLDFQPDDDGSDTDSHVGREDVAFQEFEEEAAAEDMEDMEDDSGSAAAAAPASADAEEPSPPQELCNELNQTTERLEMLRTVLLQVEQAGVENVANTVRQAIHTESKRLKDAARVNPQVRRAFADAEDDAERRALRKRAYVERNLAEDARAKQTLNGLLREQQKLQERKAQLARASSVQESLDALKRWTAADFGQGHPRGGTKAHAANRLEVLERLRRRAPALPPDLANDWGFFTRTWDARRVSMLREWHRPGWGSHFLNMMLELHKGLRAHPNGDTFTKWMREEMSWEHFPSAPLRV